VFMNVKTCGVLVKLFIHFCNVVYMYIYSHSLILSFTAVASHSDRFMH
jgi:hypothetical protein